MPQREQFFQDMAGEDRQAALLVAQVGGMPGEIQAIVQIARYDEQADGLRPLRTYIVRVLGAIEHRVVTLGTTVDTVQLTADHPLLYQYNQRPAALFFRGARVDAHELALDIAQAHASLFGPWRPFPQYLNVEQPLVNLLESEGGLLGQMPAVLAEQLGRVLERHGMEYRIFHSEDASHKPPRPDQQIQALLLGESYFISYAFSFEQMKGRARDASG